MIIKTISKSGIDLIKSFEGFCSKPYLCLSNKTTIGYGSTFYFDTGKSVKLTDDPITTTEAERLLKGHVQVYFAPMVSRICHDNLRQNQFDAVCSFLYNTGGSYLDRFGKYHHYDLFEKINRNDPDLREYWENCAITAGGMILKGLIRRRKAECDLFFKDS